MPNPILFEELGDLPEADQHEDQDRGVFDQEAAGHF